MGERAADRMRNVMGSWPFVFGFFTVMIIWAVVNTVLIRHLLHHKGFDPYPYILLNLFLSMLAGVQAAALLIAAKRADAIASEIAIHTEKNTEELKALMQENTTLTMQVKSNTDLLEEIHRHVTALSDAASAAPDPGDDAWAEGFYRRCWQAVLGATLAKGGSISHHHGIGVVRGPYLPDALGTGFEVLKRLKTALDPRGILNPGKLGLPSPFGASPWPGSS